MAPVQSGKRGLSALSEDEILDLRFCDLPICLTDSWVDILIKEIRQELKQKRLTFTPHFWVSDEWFCPDGVPGVAIPFYLFHPKLAKIHCKFTGEAEGHTLHECRKILRHEVGHAIDNAYRLRKNELRREVFGSPDRPYPRAYKPKPFSRHYVVHLGQGYAQSHPDEDFAETFAVWLNPLSNWRLRYRHWPALKKLEAMDTIMKELVGHKPLLKNQRQVGNVMNSRTKLGQYYSKRQEQMKVVEVRTLDARLRSVFSEGSTVSRAKPAHLLLRQLQKNLRRRIVNKMGCRLYEVDTLIERMVHRARLLNLRQPKTKEIELAIEKLIERSLRTEYRVMM